MEKTSEKLRAISAILRDVGQVAFAALLVEPLVHAEWNMLKIGFRINDGSLYSILHCQRDRIDRI